MEGLTIRPFQAGDRAAAQRIARQTPQAAGWVPEQNADLPCWVAETRTGLIGFLIARTVADEMEILNLAVDPSGRRRGVGAALLEAALGYGRRAGSRRAFLEVRESNLPALRFYERHGFAVFGRRPRYYRDPEDDALLMRCALLHCE